MDSVRIASRTNTPWFNSRIRTREYIRECDMNRQYYYEGFEKLHELGMVTMLIPEELGGMGADTMA